MGRNNSGGTRRGAKTPGIGRVSERPTRGRTLGGEGLSGGGGRRLSGPRPRSSGMGKTDFNSATTRRLSDNSLLTTTPVSKGTAPRYEWRGGAGTSTGRTAAELASRRELDAEIRGFATSHRSRGRGTARRQGFRN